MEQTLRRLMPWRSRAARLRRAGPGRPGVPQRPARGRRPDHRRDRQRLRQGLAPRGRRLRDRPDARPAGLIGRQR